MKPFVVVAVAISVILLLGLPTELQGAPRITSEELGKAVAQLQELLRRSKAADHGKLSQQRQPVTAQVSGVNIQNCGAAGNIINSALSVLNTLFPNDFGVLVDCQISPGCVQVRVDVPADDILADIDVCDLGNGQACVEVYVEPTTTCIGIIPINIPIPLSNGQQIFVQVLVDPMVPFFNPTGCATVRVNAPSC